MVSVLEIVTFLHTFAPPHLAEDYDNVGLLIGDHNKNIQKVLVTLDTDEAVAKEAKEIGADMIVAHHPLIFKPLRKIVAEDAVSRTAVSLIKDDIALFAMHTNFDSVKSGLCDLFLDKIGMTKSRAPMEGESEDGIGRYAELQAELPLSSMLESLKQTFQLTNIRYVGDLDKPILKIAVCNGGGAEFVYRAKELGADCYISGDIKYQHARYAYENNMALIEIPHYSAEKIFCDYAAKLLSDRFGEKMEIAITKTNVDVWKQFV